VIPESKAFLIQPDYLHLVMQNLFQEAAGAGSREAEVCLETVQHQVEAIKLFDLEARLLQADESP
jgi:hypothetical protein